MRKSSLLFIFLISLCSISFAQDDLFDMLEEEDDSGSDPVFATFKTTRLINTYTNETLGKGDIDFRIDHRFGNVSQGYQTLYGFDGIADMRLAFEYGITEDLMIGLGRSKGGFVDAFAKYKVIEQTTDNKIPVGVTLFANTGVYVNKVDESGTAFDEVAYRYSYAYQAFISRKFSSSLSMVLSPTLVHRNYVAYNDENDLIATGIGIRYAFTKSSSIIFDYFYNFDKLREFGNGTFMPPVGLGYEVETGGHVFQVMFTNATYITPNRFIGGTIDDPSKGDFKFGFNISRVF